MGWENAELMIVATSALALAGWPVSRRDLRRWSSKTGVVIDDATCDVVARSIRRRRVAAAVGLLLGLLALPVAVDAAGVHFHLGTWILFAAGFLASVVGAELVTPPPRGTVAAADLTPRRVERYLPAGVTWLTRAAAASAIAVALAALTQPTETVGERMASPATALGLAVLAAPLGVAAMEWTQRWILARPQPVASAELLVLDDAIRSRSVHVVAGAGLCFELLLVAHATLFLANRTAVDASWPLPVVIRLMAVAPAAGLCIAHGRWTAVPRRAAA